MVSRPLFHFHFPLFPSLPVYVCMYVGCPIPVEKFYNLWIYVCPPNRTPFPIAFCFLPFGFKLSHLRSQSRKKGKQTNPAVTHLLSVDIPSNNVTDTYFTKRQINNTQTPLLDIHHKHFRSKNKRPLQKSMIYSLLLTSSTSLDDWFIRE